MRTEVAEMLVVEMPICAFGHCSELVTAVCNAGGFGALGAVVRTPPCLKGQMTCVEWQSAGKPLLPAERSAFEERRSPADLNISPKSCELLLDGAFAHRVQLLASALRSGPEDFVNRTPDNDVLVASSASGRRGELVDP